MVLVRESRLGVGRRVRARRERRDHGESLDQGDVFRDVEPRNERVGERRTGNEHVGWESRRRWRRDGDDEVNPDGRVDATNACATNCPISGSVTSNATATTIKFKLVDANSPVGTVSCVWGARLAVAESAPSKGTVCLVSRVKAFVFRERFKAEPRRYTRRSHGARVGHIYAVRKRVDELEKIASREVVLRARLVGWRDRCSSRSRSVS